MFQKLSRKALVKGVFTTAATFAVASGVGIPQVEPSSHTAHTFQLDWAQSEALAQSGGRAGGGSFGGSSSPSSGGSSGSYSYNSSPYSSGDGGGVVVLLLLVLIPLCMILDAAGHSNASADVSESAATVTQLQVALKVTDGTVQQSLNRIALDMDWSSSQGLSEALKASAELLLTAAESCTHATVLSWTLPTRSHASMSFRARSRVERQSFDVESLVNESGNIHCQDVIPAVLMTATEEQTHKIEDKVIGEALDQDKYLVVTFLLGTTHQSQILYDAGSTDELQRRLTQLAHLSPFRLLKYELLWSPQNQHETITAEALGTKYPKLLPIGEKRDPKLSEPNSRVDAITLRASKGASN